jgi:hypothetical protein
VSSADASPSADAIKALCGRRAEIKNQNSKNHFHIQNLEKNKVKGSSKHLIHYNHRVLSL